jgi:hypothetical protein
MSYQTLPWILINFFKNLLILKLKILFYRFLKVFLIMWEKCLDSDCDLLFSSHSKMVNHFRSKHLGLTKLYRPQ